jgi:hypothetical protein
MPLATVAIDDAAFIAPAALKNVDFDLQLRKSG